MGDRARILTVVLLAVASMATSRVEDDEPVDAGPAPEDASPGSDATADEYRAIAVIGALDRIVVVKADHANDVCAVLRLVSPPPSGSFGVTLPANWGVEYAYVSQGTTDCLASPIPQPTEYASGGEGTVSFAVPSGSVYPTTLSADATIRFDTGAAPGWVPAAVRFVFTDLAL